jgi:hypothetical protein
LGPLLGGERKSNFGAVRSVEDTLLLQRKLSAGPYFVRLH